MCLCVKLFLDLLGLDYWGRRCRRSLWTGFKIKTEGVPVHEPSDHPPAGPYSFPCGPKESQSPSYRPVFFRIIQLTYMNAIATGESGRGELGWLLPKPPVVVTYTWPSTTCRLLLLLEFWGRRETWCYLLRELCSQLGQPGRLIGSWVTWRL